MAGVRTWEGHVRGQGACAKQRHVHRSSVHMAGAVQGRGRCDQGRGTYIAACQRPRGTEIVQLLSPKNHIQAIRMNFETSPLQKQHGSCSHVHCSRLGSVNEWSR